MPIFHLATWMRESDEPLFDKFFQLRPDISLGNARRTPLDLSLASGVLITGGPDISAPYHPDPPADPSWIRDAEPDRDAWEFQALRHAIEHRLPILCICKGFQVLNVALGGTLHFDIPGHDLPEMETANVQPLRYANGAHHRFDRVNSSHHQALNHVADALEVEAWHAEDGIIEQVRIRDYPWGIGVQYHPERDLAYTPLFADFLAQVGSGNGKASTPVPSS